MLLSLFLFDKIISFFEILAFISLSPISIVLLSILVLSSSPSFLNLALSKPLRFLARLIFLELLVLPGSTSMLSPFSMSEILPFRLFCIFSMSVFLQRCYHYTFLKILVGRH